VVIIVLGLSGLDNTSHFKPSGEEERKRVELSFDIIYRYHGKTVLDFCRACEPHFMLNIFSFINFFSAVKPSLGGENSS